MKAGDEAVKSVRDRWNPHTLNRGYLSYKDMAKSIAELHRTKQK